MPDLLSFSKHDLDKRLAELHEEWETPKPENVPSFQVQAAQMIVSDAALMIREWDDKIFDANVKLARFALDHEPSFDPEAHRLIRASSTMLAAAGRHINIENGRGSLMEAIFTIDREREEASTSLTKEEAAKKLQDCLGELHERGWDLLVTGHGVAYILGPDFEKYSPRPYPTKS